MWENPPVNAKGHLTIGGCDAVSLARHYGTPLYVMDEDILRQRCRDFSSAFAQSGVSGRVLYASKAFCTLAMCRIIREEGLSLDVVSGSELFTALRSGFPAANIYFHGNNKTESEILLAMQAGVGMFVADSHDEIELLARVAAQRNTVANVSLRLRPGVEAHTHEYIQTGQENSKFGLGINDGEAMLAIKSILAQPSLRMVGIHCHIGSQIFDRSAFEVTARIMTEFRRDVLAQTGFLLSEINYGGGYGIEYVDSDNPLVPQQYVQAIIDSTRAACSEMSMTMPSVAIEPGRAVVGSAGITLYTVGSVKRVPGGNTFVSVDGGMADNPRYALYKAEYTAMVANKAQEAPDTKVCLVGRCCESGDKLIEEAALANPQVGDTVAVFSTGAYNYAMASNYNRLPIPAVVLTRQGHAEPIVMRQTYEQLIANDRIPSWFGK